MKLYSQVPEDGGGRRGGRRAADQGVARIQAAGRARCRPPRRPRCPRRRRSIRRSIRNWCPKILALNDPFQEVRSHIGALTYQIEVTHSESSKNSLRKEIEELQEEKHEVALPGEAQKRTHELRATWTEQLQEWKDEEGQAAAAARGRS